MFFSPKHIFFGLSGTGLIGGGIAAWQLTKNNNLKNQDAADRRYQEYVEELKKECGIDIWEEKDIEEKNEKERNYDEYDTCKDSMMEKHYPAY